ncbi:uncharacterized protein LOC132031857 [Lycium ferocissimum]|uniref:uncharacterized protein LOC132031857 n=1 Tax=Lycium ferocissimum TaxID=112874 RepID=UPI002814A78F|nr:uncharacterized protein LOC132031857 [Lycium ferocissimum]
MLLVNQTMLIHRKIVRQTLSVLYFLLSYDGVQGEIKLSKVEYLELEKQLKLLNKPAVKIIKMKPTLARTLHNSTKLTAIRSSSIWLKEEGCPFGTIPIKRVTKEDLIRQRHIQPPEAIIFEDQLINVR